MVFKAIFLCILVAHHFRTCVCFDNCIPVECLECPITALPLLDTCWISSNQTHVNASGIQDACKKDFKVSINSTGSTLEEGSSITLSCVHDIPIQIKVTYKWKKDSKEIEEQRSNFTVEKALYHHAGHYICVVQSSCGSYESLPHGVTVNSNNIIILVICGCSALVLVVILGITMKIKLQRDKAKNNLRTKQRLQEIRRAQELQTHGPGPNPTLS